MWMELHCLGPHCYPTTLHVPTHFLSHFQAFIWTQCRHTTFPVSIAMPRPGIQSRVCPSNNPEKKNFSMLLNLNSWTGRNSYPFPVSLLFLCRDWSFEIVRPDNGAAAAGIVFFFFLPPVSGLTLLWHNGTAPHQRAVQSERDGQSQ